MIARGRLYGKLVEDFVMVNYIIELFYCVIARASNVFLFILSLFLYQISKKKKYKKMNLIYQGTLFEI